jgi:hypothetical protein
MQRLRVPGRGRAEFNDPAERIDRPQLGYDGMCATSRKVQA